MDGWAALTALLLSPEGRAALTSGTPGQVVKLVRLTLRWTQQELATRSGWSQSTISALTQLHHTIDLVGRQNYPPATSFAAAARQLLPASA